MTVIFVFDKYGIDEAPAITVDAEGLFDIRARIRAHLLNPDEKPCLRVRMPPEYRQRFADFIGFNGVECLFIEPRSEFAKKFNIAVPSWLTDALLATLGLGKIPADIPNPVDADEDITGWILYLLDSALVQPESWLAFCKALRNPLFSANNLLSITEVRERLAQSLQVFISSRTTVNLFLEKCTTYPAPELALMHWGRQQAYERLREFTTRHNISHPLPPRIESAEFLNSLPLLQISEDEAGSNLVDDLISLLEEMLLSIEDGKSQANCLSELVLADWPKVFVFLQERMAEARIPLASLELAEAVGRYPSYEAMALTEVIRQQLSSCNPLPERADIETTKLWIKEYLEYALRRFLLGQEPDEKASSSFSSWVLQQQARISRSDLDWRCVANAIHEQLQRPETRVIVCMVDALSAIHNAQILAILHEKLSQDGLALEGHYVIAPYPTLTEIGKNAVLTGKPATETNGPRENCIYQAYKDKLEDSSTIHVIKSWNDRNQIVPKQTRLLIYLENRLDERLHGCTDYGKFHKDVEVIVQQLAKEINRWIKQSHNQGFEPVVIITADHGVSYINHLASLQWMESAPGICGERFMESSGPAPSWGDFNKVEAGGKNYLIPLHRVRLKGDIPLCHGGLTPEELLIPFIILRKNCLSPISEPLLQLTQKKQGAVIVKEAKWHLELMLQASCTAHNVRLEAQPPFRGSSGPYGPLQKGEAIPIAFGLEADIHQEGLLNVDLSVTFFRPENTSSERLHLKLPISFPARLLEKDAGAAAFDDMF